MVPTSECARPSTAGTHNPCEWTQGGVEGAGSTSAMRHLGTTGGTQKLFDEECGPAALVPPAQPRAMGRANVRTTLSSATVGCMRHLLCLFLVGCSSGTSGAGAPDPLPVEDPGTEPPTAVEPEPDPLAPIAMGGEPGAGGAATTYPPNAGGVQSSGGALATGGQSTGGEPATGGSTSTGGEPATGGTMSSGGSPATGGAPPVAPDACDPPSVQGGNACGGACDWTLDSRPSPLGWSDTCTPCTPRALDGWESWASVLPASLPFCAARLPGDAPTRATFAIRGDTCFKFTAPWSTLRVHYPAANWPHPYTDTPQFDECAVVQGVDAVGNMPDVLVEVSGPNVEQWVSAEAVDCSSTCD